MNPERSRKPVNTKALFYPTLAIIPVTVLIVWITGLEIHRSLYYNAMTSLSLLVIGFFLFLTYGLYHGFRLKDDIGKITDSIKRANMPDLSNIGGFVDVPETDSIISSVLAWIAAAIVAVAFLWFFGTFLWSAGAALAAMLYWIYFRAVKFVFRKSNRCRGYLGISMAYALYYTVLYSCWIYGIVWGVHLLAK